MKSVYVVTKDSNDGTFIVGDHIKFNDDGSVSCKEAQGWIDKEDVEKACQGMEYEIDLKQLEKMKEKISKDLEELEKMMKE